MFATKHRCGLFAEKSRRSLLAAKSRRALPAAKSRSHLRLCKHGATTYNQQLSPVMYSDCLLYSRRIRSYRRNAMANIGKQRRRAKHQNIRLQVFKITRYFISYSMHITMWLTLLCVGLLSVVQQVQIHKMQFENG